MTFTSLYSYEDLKQHCHFNQIELGKKRKYTTNASQLYIPIEGSTFYNNG